MRKRYGEISDVGKYYDAMKRVLPETAPEPIAETEPLRLNEEAGLATTSLVPLPAMHEVPSELSRADTIRRLSERIAPLAVVDRSVRLVIGGCRPQDGASTIAAAIA